VVITRADSIFNEDGVNTFLFELSSAMITAGHEVYIISGCKKSTFSSDKLAFLFDVENMPVIHYLKNTKFRNNFEEVLFWHFRGTSVLRKLNPILTIINGTVPFWSSGSKVCICHGLRTSNFYPFSQRCYQFFMYRLIGSMVAVSYPLQQELKEKLGINNAKIIPIGLDTGKYSCLPLQSREKAMLHVGTRNVKNLTTTLKAFKELSNRIVDVKLYITGAKPAESNAVKDINSEKIKFLGIVPKNVLRSLYSKVVAVSAPSLYESFSYATLEAFASGTPVVGSQAIPNALLVDGWNGYRISYPENHLMLADRLFRLFSDKTLWTFMSKNAVSTSLEYDIRKIAELYIQTVRL
jgi:glycosyltransferase involved in cell wall biosynthesis